MKRNDFLQVAGALFILVALLHALRVLMGWEVIINGQQVPMVVSYVGALVGGFLGYTAFKHVKK